MTVTTGSPVVQHAIGPAGRLELRQASGSIRIRGIDGGVARVRELNGRAIDESFRVVAGDGRLSLVPVDRSAFELMLAIARRSSQDLEIEVPHGAIVSIESASAGVDGAGLSGRTSIRTASGDIALEGVAGVVELVAVSGDVHIVTDGALDLTAQTISGDVAVRASRLGRAAISTTSGDVQVDAVLDGPGPFGIRTVSGDATIVGRMGLRVEARTVTGEVTSDLPHRRETAPGRRTVVIGDGGTVLAFGSVSGGLRLTTPRDALPAEAIAGERMPGRASPAPPIPPVPASPTVPAAGPGGEGPALEASDRARDAARLDALRALERGDLTVEAAMRRLAEIEEA